MEVYWGVIITRYISSEKNQSLLPASLPSKAKLNFLPVWVRGSLFIAGTDSPSCNARMIFFFQLQMFPSCGKHRYKYSFLCLKRKWLPITVNIPRGFLASTHTGRGDGADGSLRGLPFTAGPWAKCKDIFRLCCQLRNLVIMVNSDVSHTSWSSLLSPGIVAAE